MLAALFFLFLFVKKRVASYVAFLHLPYLFLESTDGNVSKTLSHGTSIMASSSAATKPVKRTVR